MFFAYNFYTVTDSITNMCMKNDRLEKTNILSPRSAWFGWAVTKWRPCEISRIMFFAYNFYTVTDSITNMCMKNDRLEKTNILSPRSAWFGWAVSKLEIGRKPWNSFFVNNFKTINNFELGPSPINLGDISCIRKYICHRSNVKFRLLRHD